MDLIPTYRSEDRCLVPLSFDCSEPDYHLIVHLIHTWACKIMLSGLLQSLLSYGISVQEATLSELQATERRYAMLICMTVDFAESLMPYGCVCHLLPMEIAWGVYWRQQGAFHGVDCEGMMGWLHRRTNKFLACAVSEGEMGSTGMAYFTERLMGGASPARWWGVMQEAKAIEADCAYWE